ncbi:MAG: hypothetical protein MEQ84_01830 [Mesorhizobium sp.]|nr:hypothetical protein [Mesorhizobium sp.]
MSGAASQAQDLPEPNALERRASLYLQHKSSGLESRGSDRGVDQDKLARVRRNAVIWAVVSGLLSGAIIGGSEAWLRLSYQGGIESLPFWDQVPYWAAFYAFVGVVTIVEMAFLYWNALDATARINALLGAPLDEQDRSELLSVGLARAALESPNPHHVVHGVDPYALMPRWRLIAQNLLYKLKVGASSFIMRIVMRRLFARAALRGFIPLLAIPLYAVWNAWITWRIIDEVRLRALGPGAIDTVVDIVKTQEGGLSDKATDILLHGVAETVMRGYDAHPNYILLVERLVDEVDPDREEIETDWENDRDRLDRLSDGEKTIVLDVLTLATVLAGRPRRAQRDFLKDAHEQAGRKFDPQALKKLAKAFTAGRGVDAQELEKVRGPAAD